MGAGTAAEKRPCTLIDVHGLSLLDAPLWVHLGPSIAGHRCSITDAGQVVFAQRRRPSAAANLGADVLQRLTAAERALISRATRRCGLSAGNTILRLTANFSGFGNSGMTPLRSSICVRGRDRRTRIA
jgi:hypothetical protein